MSERFGASFSIDVNNLKSGLSTANKLIRESQSEFKKAAAGLDDWTKSEEGLTAKIKSLNSIIDVQTKKVEALKKQYQNELAKGMDEASDRAIYLRTQINKEETALESNKKEVEKQQKALENLTDASDDTSESFEDVGNTAENTSGQFTVMKGALADLVADGFRLAINKAKEFATELVNVGSSFDDAMAKVGAVSGASEAELEALREKAKEMGSTTKFTASEAAEAFNYMAMAGWKTEDMLSGIEGILNLAAASGSDLGTTSDIVTDALTAMGYEAKDAGRLANVMASASSNANTNVEMMGQTFQYAAPIVGALGYSMEDTAVQIGLMANAGIKGEKAGTALRSILTRLSAPPKECADAMAELNISMTNSDGTMKSLDEVMGDLREGFSNLSETEQTSMAKHIAGQEAMSGLLAIVNAAPSDFKKLQKAVEESDGAAQNMADTMLNTLGGDMTILNSQLEGVKLTIYEQLSPTLRNFVKQAQKAIEKINWENVGKKANDILKKLSDTAKKFATNVLPTAKTALSLIGKVLGFVIDNFEALAKGVFVAITAFTTFKAVMAIITTITAVKSAISALSVGVGLATKAQAVWNATLSANPIGAVVTAVALLAAGIGVLVTSMQNSSKESDEFWKKQKEVTEQTDTLTEAVNNQKDSYENLKDEQQKLVNSQQSEFQYYDNLWQELQGIVDQNGKVKEGYEQRASFITSQLSEATGTEIQLVDGVIQKYGELKATIDEVIKKKKYQIWLDSQETLYKDAIANQEDALVDYMEAVDLYNDQLAEQERLTAAVNKANDEYNELFQSGGWSLSGMMTADQVKKLEELNTLRAQLDSVNENLPKLEQAYKDAENLTKEYAYNIGVYEHNLEAVHNENYDSFITKTWEYVDEFEKAANTEKELLQKQIDAKKEKLRILEEANAESQDKILTSQIESEKKLLADMELQMDRYNSAAEIKLDGYTHVWDTSLKKTISNITGKSTEFYMAGENLVQMVVNGQKVGEALPPAEMEKIVNSIIQKVENGQIDAETAGKNIIEGVTSGIKNKDKQNSAFSSISIFGNTLLGRLQSSLQEKSPSKASRSMGQYLIEGLSMGIKDEQNSVFNQISQFGKKVVSRMNDNISDLSNYGGLYDDISMGIGVHNSSTGVGNKNVTINQYNTYSRAHSRYELYQSKRETAAAVRLAMKAV